MLLLKHLKLGSHLLNELLPLFIEIVVLFKLGAHMPLILLVVGGDLRLTLLIDFDLKSTFTRPLLP